MDPFDELTRVSTVATPNRQDFGTALPASAYQVGGLQLSPQPMQSVNTATAAGGNPFVDIHPPAAATPTRTRPARASAFQVCRNNASIHAAVAGLRRSHPACANLPL